MDVAKHHRSRPWSIEDARSLYEARGCVLLESDYLGYTRKMRYRCVGGHEHSLRFDHFVAGHGCPRCRSERRWQGRRIDLKEVTVALEQRGLVDIDIKRMRSRIHVAYTCPAGHRVRTQYAHLAEGKRCRRCATRRGPEHPSYNATLTADERLLARKYDAYYAWRTSVFERDAHKCRRCGAGGRMNAHHIVSYSSDRSLRTDLSNGITLCVRCHRGFHGAYGYRNNNASQLSQFIASAESSIIWV